LSVEKWNALIEKGPVYLKAVQGGADHQLYSLERRGVAADGFVITAPVAFLTITGPSPGFSNPAHELDKLGKRPSAFEKDRFCSEQVNAASGRYSSRRAAARG